jgi:hypothetical protein
MRWHPPIAMCRLNSVTECASLGCDVRGLHSALEKLKQPKAGFHAFRRYRLTWLRKNRVHADLERFWMGHENETVGDGYSKMKEDVAFRLEQAEKVGLGFALPPKIADVARIARKNEAKPEVENAE